ncbi:MAG: phosphatase [Clostridiales bacterium]|nr:phosphatase [Clostridiales bacterium]
MRKMVIDTHVHTISSGHAYSTLGEDCFEAGKKGMKLIAITDHGPAMPGGPHIFHIGNQKVYPDFINGVEVLKGVEANILDCTGKIDIEEKILSKLEIVIASLHDHCIKPGSIKENTSAIIGAMKNKYVDIIAHPGNPAFPIEIDEVLKAAMEYNVLIEINNSSLGTSRAGSEDNCRRIAEAAALNGNMIALGSDAHICFAIGEFDKALGLIKDAGIKDENIINTNVDKLKDFLRKRGKHLNR